jgi:enterochelin esterase-like enzyme
LTKIFSARSIVPVLCGHLFFGLLLTGALRAQTPKAPAITSPQVLPERLVAFRVYAPNAREVQVVGDWLRRGEVPNAMEKGADGVWSVTVGPLQPGVYSYTFLVDGVRTTDQANSRTILTAGRSASSVVEVRGDRPLPWEERNAPRGTIHIEAYHSTLQDCERRFSVYTPPGYNDRRREKYPVFVLLPGTPGNESDWINVGLAHRIFDNLLADRKMVEMLALMPPADVLRKGGTRADNLKEFEPLLLKEILPLFEQRYHVHRRPEARAIAGLSLGGELALTVGLRHPEIFQWVASFSGSLFEKDFADRFGAFLDRPDAISKAPKFIWIGCGSGDLFLPGSKKLSEILTAKGIRNTLRETEGYHTWLVWRPYLAEVLPLLFRRQI